MTPGQPPGRRQVVTRAFSPARLPMAKPPAPPSPSRLQGTPRRVPIAQPNAFTKRMPVNKPPALPKLPRM